MAIIERVIDLPYAPRRVFLPYHDRSARFTVGVAHRRCGKTVATVNDQIRRAVTSDKPNCRAAYIAPFFNQAKDIAWQYLKRFAAPIISKVNEGDAYIELVNGARLRIYGADNPDRLRGGYLDDVVLDEYADMYPGIFGEIIRPMLADRQGTATFIGTPKGRNAFFDLYQRAGVDPDWSRFMLRASETGIIPQAELDDARRDMTPEQYDQEFECSFEAAIVGAYYGREMAQAEREGRLCEIEPIDAPIDLVWDFGNGANMAVWAFQVVDGGILVVDFIQMAGCYFEDYLKECNKRGYRGIDYVPHDAKVPSFETGRTRIETMRAYDRTPKLIADHFVEDRINALRLTLPRMKFNAIRCAHGLEALRQYRQEWDDKARVFKKTPKHDWSSHPADAAGYLAMAWRELAPPPPASVGPIMKGLHDMTFDDLHAFDSEPKREARV